MRASVDHLKQTQGRTSRLPQLSVLLACMLAACGTTPTRTEISWQQLPLPAEDSRLLVEKQTRYCVQLAQGAFQDVLSETDGLLWQYRCRAFLHTPTFENLTQHFVPTVYTSGVFTQKPLGKSTGYYAPVIKASAVKTDAYPIPLRKKPADMVQVRLKDFDTALPETTFIGRVAEGRLKPYPARAAIEAETPQDDAVLAWLEDPIDKLFLQIQGSGYLQYPDGSRHVARYAANNGHTYTAIGRVLVRDYGLDVADVNMFTLKAWLKQHPEAQEKVINANPRYIYFQLGDAIKGSGNRDLTPLVSAATDPAYIATGMPFYLKTTLNAEQAMPFEKVMLAEDTGAAIRGAGRVDIYMGEGETAEKRAAYQNAPAETYLFLPKARKK